MHFKSKFDKGFRFLLFAIDIHSKYSWFIPLKDNKGITTINAFQKVLDESKRKTNKVWANIGSTFYNRSMKPWIEKNVTEMYSTHNEGKNVIAEKLIRSLKNKVYKYELQYQNMFMLVNWMI